MTVVEQEVFAPAKILTETEKRARTLEAAALEIEVHGWSRCDRRTTGEMCVNGALFTALGWNGRLCDLGDNLLDAEKVWGGGYDYNRVSNFNDKQSIEDGPVVSSFLLRWRAEEIRDGWDA